jgi:peptidoglycan/xylan/chitin deacetylase (PgdA/CDA1 family)
MTIGSHGMTHRPWRSLADRELGAELADATKVISSAAGQTIREVACPFGCYDRRVLGAIRRNGFRRVYTVDGAAARRDAWLQSRYTLRSHHTAADLERLIRAPRGSAFGSAVRTSKTLIKRLR